MSTLRVVYFGNFNSLSVYFLSALTQLQTDVVAVILPGYGLFARSTSDLPVTNNKSEPMTHLIQSAGIPFCHVGAGEWPDESRTFLHRWQPDIILSVCFPHFIPEGVRKVAKQGSFNFHSSLLPAYRGPAPVFWQLYYGENNTGVSIHQLSDDIDGGEIYCQQEVSWPVGASADQIDQLLANEGTQQFSILLKALENNTATCYAQDGSVMSYFPAPCANDTIVPTSWSARRAFNFIRGLAGRALPVVIRTPKEDIPVRRAVGFSSNEIGESLQAGELDIPFTPGVLRVRRSE